MNATNPEAPSYALQRTAPCVTAPASAAAFLPTMQVPRRSGVSLSLRSFARAIAMRTLILIGTLLLACNMSWSQDSASVERFGTTLVDPRQPVSLYTMFEDGEAPKTTKLISNSILLVCWMPAPDGSFGRYQIGGLEGYHTKEQVQRFLARFYEMDHQKETRSDCPNVILAGNNWGAGLELKDTLRELSRVKSLGVYYAGGWAFSKVSFISESDDRKKLMRRCYEEANP